jgi:L-fucose isomerase-like protein
MKKLIIGFVSMAQPYNTDKELAAKMYKLAKNKMSELINVEVVSPEGLIISMEDAQAAVELLKANPVDLLIVQNGTFSSGQAFMHLVQNFSGFIVLWAMPEPPYNGPLKFNSLCGINLNASLLSNMERQYKYFYASPENSEFWLDFAKWLKVFSFVKRLKEVRIGLFGSRTPGFYTFGLNELSVRKIIGPVSYGFRVREPPNPKAKGYSPAKILLEISAASFITSLISAPSWITLIKAG